MTKINYFIKHGICNPADNHIPTAILTAYFCAFNFHKMNISAWLGGSAINQISIAIFGYDNVVLFFLLFQVVQIILSVKGFHGIKWVENIGGVVIVSAMLYMLFVCVTQYWGVIGDKLTFGVT